ncbi:MAG: methyltransferase domain-containing protein [Spirochaetota bacterium]
MSLLLVPETAAGRGSGHLRRAIRLQQLVPDAWILVRDPTEGVEEALREAEAARVLRVEADGPVPERSWDRIVIDKFHVSITEATELSRFAPTIGIDLGGPGRSYADYLIDTLPRIDGETPNIADERFLDLPRAEANPPTSSGGTRHVLISFGGEDPARLTEQTAALLAPGGSHHRVTVVRPVMRELGPIAAGVRVIPPQPSLAPVLESADWVITSFGLTAYEAAALGRRVITVAPTHYHDRLAARAGFYRAGVGRPAPWRLSRALATNAAHGPESGRWPGPDPEALASRRPLAEYIEDLALPSVRGCPAHRGERGRAVRRSEDKTYFVCPRCGLVYMERFARDEETYGESYFMDEYKAQYGKTYLDDFDHIYAMGVRRIREIRSVMSGRQRAPLRDRRPSLLDVGCAYGPFLAAARDAGFDPVGIDVAPEAVNYVNHSLEIRAVNAGILEVDADDLGRGQFDVITLWYVVEHFDALAALLEKLCRLVRRGGVLALATPHGEGVSARRDPEGFYRRSPRDHFTIWSRASARRLLAEYGFSVRRFVVTGHHPERYPAVRRRLLPRGFARLHTRAFGWGDTFEIYAVKERS